jgi:IS5 family transposase
VKVDAASKLIVAQKITPAHANDGRQLADLANADDKTVFAESAYQTPGNRALLKRKRPAGSFNYPQVRLARSGT